MDVITLLYHSEEGSSAPVKVVESSSRLSSLIITPNPFSNKGKVIKIESRIKGTSSVKTTNSTRKVVFVSEI